MQPLKLNESIPPGKIEGHACVCCTCGADVFPLPLRVNPDVHIVRAIVRGVSIVDSRTGKRRNCAILFCPACANPEEVRDYEQLESVPTHNAAAHAACVAATDVSARRARSNRRTDVPPAMSRCADALSCVMMRTMEKSAMS